jgi:hypothetical protein
MSLQSQSSGSANADQRLREFEDKMRKLFPEKNLIMSRRDPFNSESRSQCIMRRNPNVLLVVYHWKLLFDYYGGGFKGEALDLFGEYKDVLGTVPYEYLDVAVLVYKRQSQPVEKSQNKKETRTDQKKRKMTVIKTNSNETARKKARVAKIKLVKTTWEELTRYPWDTNIQHTIQYRKRLLENYDRRLQDRQEELKKEKLILMEEIQHLDAKRKEKDHK